MAERYGGPHSPKGHSGAGAPVRGARRARRGAARVNFLFLLPVFFIFTAFGRDPVGFGTGFLAFGILILAAWLTREGLRAEEAFEERKVARRPAIPRKMFGSALTGLGLAIAGYGAGAGVLAAAIFVVLGAVLHGFAFGLDPLKDKGVEGVDEFQAGRVARAVDEAEKHLGAMRDAILRANDRKLELRVERFQATARDMFRTVEEDPRDLSAARRYLGVYLLGARDATIKFADIYARSRDETARSDYVALLDDLEDSFAARTRKMLLEDRSGLDVEIDVLRARLEREGVKAAE